MGLGGFGGSFGGIFGNGFEDTLGCVTGDDSCKKTSL